MKVLFLHPKFPGQFWKLAAFLANKSEHQVTFITEQKEMSLRGVTKVTYPVPPQNPATHPFLRNTELAVLHSRAAAEAARELRESGYRPDVIYGYAGAWSNALFIRDVFPQTPLIGYFEWFTHSHGGEYNFDPAYLLTVDQEYAARCGNMPNWLILDASSRGISPTAWQRSRFPREFQAKIEVIYDGVDTEYYKPDGGAVFTNPQTGASFAVADEVLTYATRGMEPMRGFQQFMEAAAIVQQRRSRCQVIVAGTDKTWYSKSAADDKTYKELLLDRLSFDPARLHFTGVLNLNNYRRLLQVSSAHVYLTRPYVLSWSVMEALATGCVVVGSDTPPVREIIEHGRNGFLADFFSPQDIADKVCHALDKRQDVQRIRDAARSLACEQYSLPAVLPKHLALLAKITGAAQ